MVSTQMSSRRAGLLCLLCSALSLRAGAQPAPGTSPETTPRTTPVSPIVPEDGRAAVRRDPEIERYLEIGLGIDCAGSLAEHLSHPPADRRELHRRLGQIVMHGPPRAWVVTQAAAMIHLRDFGAPWMTGQCPLSLTLGGTPCVSKVTRGSYEQAIAWKIRERALAQFRALAPDAAREVDVWRNEPRLDPRINALLSR